MLYNLWNISWQGGQGGPGQGGNNGGAGSTATAVATSASGPTNGGKILVLFFLITLQIF